jgi:transcriptional regulator with XRE-family HTH domain
MSNSEPFGPWVEAMEKAGAVDPRNGRPSWNQLAMRAGVSTTAVTNAATGKTKAKASTILRISGALHLPPETVSTWVGAVAPVSGPWTPVQESALLSRDERRAMDDLIRAIVRGREAGELRGDTASMNFDETLQSALVAQDADARTGDVSDVDYTLAANEGEDAAREFEGHEDQP